MKRLVAGFLWVLSLAGVSAQVSLVPLWEYPVGGRVLGDPVVSRPGGSLRVYAVAEDRQLHALSSQGKPVWKAYLANLPGGLLAVGRDESVYLSLSPGSVGAVSLRGKVIWKTALGAGPVEGLALSERGLIFAITQEGLLACLDHRGRVRWSRRLGGGPSAPPVYVPGLGVVTATKDQRITAYSPGGGRLWQSLPAAPADALVPFPGGVAASTGGTLGFFDYQGRLLWSRSFPSAGAARLLGNGRGFLQRDDTLIRFTPGPADNDRTGRAEENLNFKGHTLLALGDGEKLLGSDEGRQTLFFSGPFEEEQFKLAVPFTGAVLAPGGLFFTGAADWKVRAFSLPLEPDQGWNQAQGGFRRSGRGDFPPLSGDDITLMDRIYLEVMAASPAEEDKLRVLSEIRRGLEEDRYTGTEPSLLKLLERLAGEGMENPQYQGKRVVNDFPRVRSEAASILGEWGDLASREVLLRIFTYEWSSQAALIQAQSLGLLGSDPFGDFTRQLASRVESLRSEVDRYLWGSFALRVLENLMAYNGGYPDPAGARMVYSLYQGGYGGEAKKKALELLSP